MTDPVLSGCRIVIVEDDYYQAQDSRQMLELAGAKVIAVSATLPDLPGLLAAGRIDAALIDINLGHGVSFDFARELDRHAIPFVFLTGYDSNILPADLCGRPCLSKPAEAGRVVSVLAQMVAGGA